MNNDTRRNKIPLVTVIVPVYNAEPYLEKCYDSLKNQTYSNLEIIFVNDASTDKSLDLLRKFQEQDRRVIIVEQDENKGVSVARNAGLDICTGEYIGFCDADDLCEYTMFERMATMLQRYEADIACCALRRIGKTQEILETLWQAPDGLLLCREEAMKKWLTAQYIGNSVCTKLARRGMWERLRFPAGEVFEEAQVIPQLIAKASKVVHTGTVEYNYFVRKDSITSRSPDERLLAVVKRTQHIEEYIETFFPNLKSEANSFTVRNSIGITISAEKARGRMDARVYNEIRQNFNKVFWKGLFNRYISLEEKIKMLAVKMMLYYLKGKLLRE